MGDRGMVRFDYGQDGTIGFYTHWGGSELENTLRAALIRGRRRWSDSSYLARIIFSEMIRDSVLDETGYGICPWVPGDLNNPTITVFSETEEIQIEGCEKVSFADFCMLL
jgi:hypothetical protein